MAAECSVLTGQVICVRSLASSCAWQLFYLASVSSDSLGNVEVFGEGGSSESL